MKTSAQDAAKAVAANEAAQRRHAMAQRASLSAGKPKLTADNAVAFLDWITTHVVGHQMTHEEAKLLMHAAALAISTQHAEAQGKATQHTLVEEGIIDPPPGGSQSWANPT